MGQTDRRMDERTNERPYRPKNIMLLSGALKCIPISGNQSLENGLSKLSNIRRNFNSLFILRKLQTANPLQKNFQTHEQGPRDIKKIIIAMKCHEGCIQT